MTPNLDTPFLPVRQWSLVARCCPGHTYNLLRQGVISAVKDGARTLIREPPRLYLENLPAFTPGEGRPGPGRPRRTRAAAAPPPA